MRSKQLQLFVSTMIILAFSSCTRTTEEFTSEPLSDYLPLQTGKYIVYQLDSTLFTNFGTTTEIHSYQEKHLIDAQITDALGRQGYRIFRFLRDVTGTTPWAPAGSYFIIPNDKTIEVVENNLRFIRLALPLKKDFSWKGIFVPTGSCSKSIAWLFKRFIVNGNHSIKQRDFFSPQVPSETAWQFWTCEGFYLK